MIIWRVCLPYIIKSKYEGNKSPVTMSYRNRITIEPDKRGGKPCIRGMRITVYDVLSYLASGMSYDEILEDFPYLTKEDILASLEYAAERERYTLTATV
jgi:uncharacterized protein (DUF433 family)